MDKSFEQDTIVSHNILNYLFAGYQGSYTYESVTLDFGAPSASLQRKDEFAAILTKVLEWLNALERGDCLFAASWTTPQTFDAQKAIKWLEELKKPISLSASNLRRIVREPDLRGSKEDFIELVASFARFAYSGKFYNEGMLYAAKLLNRKDVTEGLKIPVEQSNAEMNHAGYFIHLLKTVGADTYPADYLAVLLDDARRAPSIFNAQIHDINQLLAQFNGGITWSSVDFSLAESELWKAKSFKPGEAGYWRAYELGPDEAVEWRKAGFLTPGIAAAWRNERFDPKTAAGWASQGASPLLARKWLDAGHAPNEAFSYITKGILDPANLPKGE
jgi:hypothetical protein